MAKAKRSASAKQKDATRRTPKNLPVQSFLDLLKDMGTLTLIHRKTLGSAANLCLIGGSGLH
ncbi:MAG: hypothetical protein H7Z17_15005 [Fuerstia sp.]|nr:hypothetical protein [Fuerstiella sp.]